jgi:hypothetical protein
MDGIEGGDFIWIDFGIMDCGPPIPFGFCKEMVCTWRIEVMVMFGVFLSGLCVATLLYLKSCIFNSSLHSFIVIFDILVSLLIHR